MMKNTKFESQKISSFVIKKPLITSLRLNLFQHSKVLLETSGVVLKIDLRKQDGRFVAMATRDLQTLNLNFGQVMFNSL